MTVICRWVSKAKLVELDKLIALDSVVALAGVLHETHVPVTDKTSGAAVLV